METWKKLIPFVIAVVCLGGCQSPNKSVEKTRQVQMYAQAPVYGLTKSTFTGISSEYNTAEESVEAAYHDIFKQLMLHAGIKSKYVYLSGYSESGIEIGSTVSTSASAITDNFVRIDRVHEVRTLRRNSGKYQSMVRASGINETLEDIQTWAEYRRNIEIEKIRKPYLEISCVGTSPIGKGISKTLAVTKAKRLARMDCYRQFAELTNSYAVTRVDQLGNTVNFSISLIAKTPIPAHEVLSEVVSTEGNEIKSDIRMKFPNQRPD